MISRFKENPILKPCDIKVSNPEAEIACLLNPGCFRFNNRIGLLLRVAERPLPKESKYSFPIKFENDQLQIIETTLNDPHLDLSDPRVIKYKGQHYLTTLSYLVPVFSEDGVHFKEDSSFPRIFGDERHSEYGIEDCRVTQIEDSYILTFTAVSSNGVAVGMKQTKDWKKFSDLQIILPAHNKDCAVFLEKINGKYYALHRPSSPEIGGNYIWITESLDLIHWGNHRCLAKTREGYWDEGRIGAGAAPIKTEKGWLSIYHGATKDNRYCLGALLLDLNNPEIVLARSEKPIMEPVEDYETIGFFGDVIFTNGHVVNGDELILYYGAADEVICGAKTTISSILNSLNI